MSETPLLATDELTRLAGETAHQMADNHLSDQRDDQAEAPQPTADNASTHTSASTNTFTSAPPQQQQQQQQQQPQQQQPQQQPSLAAIQQQSIVQVRDRLFHALFYRIAIIYARKFPRLMRRLIEFFMLLTALGSFALLTYLHVIFNRSPINCLGAIEDIWPRDGILRVEILHNASQFYLLSTAADAAGNANANATDNQTTQATNDAYSLKQSYEKEYSQSILDLFSATANAGSASAAATTPTSTDDDEEAATGVNKDELAHIGQSGTAQTVLVTSEN